MSLELTPKTLLDDEDLSNFDIRVSQFDLKGDGKWSDGTSGFFTPLTHDALPTLPEVDMEGLEYTESSDPYHIGRRTDGNIQEFLSELEGEGGLRDPFKWGMGDHPRDGFWVALSEVGVPGVDNSPYEWQTLGFLDTFTTEYPYQVVRSAHGLEPDDNPVAAVTRSEMILLVVMTLLRMVVPRLAEHEIYPILIVSSCSYQTRFVQGFFDGQTFHVSLSRFLNNRDDIEKHMGLILRWTLSDPVGDTKVPTKTDLSNYSESKRAAPAGARTGSVAVH